MRKKGLLSSGLAMLLYSIESVTIQRELSSGRPEVTTAYFYLWSGVMVVIVGVPLGILFGWIEFERGISVSYRWHAFIVFCLVVEAFADFFIFAASSQKVGAVGIAIVISFSPIVAVMLESLLDWETPSLRQVFGCCLIPIAVYLAVPRTVNM